MAFFAFKPPRKGSKCLRSGWGDAQKIMRNSRATDVEGGRLVAADRRFFGGPASDRRLSAIDYDLVETPAFLWVLGLVALLAAFALLFAGFAFSRLWNFGDRGGRDLIVGALLALLVLAPYGIAAYWAATYPPLRDISTDFDNPPALDTHRPGPGI